MQIIVISGLSGAGKSIALETFEDEGFFCVENIPLSLLLPFIEKFLSQPNERNLAVVVDARGFLESPDEEYLVFNLLNKLQQKVDWLYLDASSEVVLQRYRATRRRHPFYQKHQSLLETIEWERSILKPFLDNADLHIDTSDFNVHELRVLLKERLLMTEAKQLSVQLESFAYKEGIPLNADFVFDVRCLTNPHWKTELRDNTGMDSDVAAYLDDCEDVQNYLRDLKQFFDHWLPKFTEGTRAYLTIAIGCSGGKHRSVYCVEQLATYISQTFPCIKKHRELEKL